MQASPSFVASFVASAVYSIAVEAATAAAKAQAAGVSTDAWAAASAIADAADSAAATAATRAVIFSLGAEAAHEVFKVARVAAGALSDDAKWPAFASAASTAKNALAYGVWVSGMGKTEAGKATKAAKETIARAALPEAVRLGLVSETSDAEAAATALRAQLADAHVKHEAAAKEAADKLTEATHAAAKAVHEAKAAKAEAEAAKAEAAEAKAEAKAMQADMEAAEAKAAKATKAAKA